MIRKSRYDNTQPFTPDPSDGSAFKGLRPRDITIATGVIEHTVAARDRLDLVANYYFENSRLWYRLADANPNFLFAPDMFLDLGENGSHPNDPLQREDMIGRTILIPKAEE